MSPPQLFPPPLPHFVLLRPKEFLLWLSFFEATSGSILSGAFDQANVKAFLRPHLPYWNGLFERAERDRSIFAAFPVSRTGRGNPSVGEVILRSVLARVTGWQLVRTDDYIHMCDATRAFRHWLDGEEYNVEDPAELRKLIDLRVDLSGGTITLRYGAVKLSRFVEHINWTEYYCCTPWRHPHPLKETLQMLTELPW
ncbi:MAG: hypothetical protein H7145_17960 [Akkermansiaceae bacterium]|nr:hypothetical protein [Armatimonadota bacterium]